MQHYYFIEKANGERIHIKDTKEMTAKEAINRLMFTDKFVRLISTPMMTVIKGRNAMKFAPKVPNLKYGGRGRGTVQHGDYRGA